VSADAHAIDAGVATQTVVPRPARSSRGGRFGERGLRRFGDAASGFDERGDELHRIRSPNAFGRE
jgi:hypothetical protein